MLSTLEAQTPSRGKHLAVEHERMRALDLEKSKIMRAVLACQATMQVVGFMLPLLPQQ